MPSKYKDNSERYAFHMLFEGAAVVLVILLLAFDARIQNFLFAGSSSPHKQELAEFRADLMERVEPLAMNQDELSIDTGESADLGSYELSTSIDSNDQAYPELNLKEELTLDPDSHNDDYDIGIEHDESIAVLDDTRLDAGLSVDMEAEGGLLNNQPEIIGLDAQPEPREFTPAPQEDSIAIDDKNHSKNFNSSRPAETLNSDFNKFESGTKAPFNPVAEESPTSLAQMQTQKFIPTDPTWWYREFEKPQLPNRVPVRASLDEVIFVALRTSPQLTIFNLQPAIQQTFVREEIASFDWGTFVETAWNELDEPIGSDLTTGLGGRFVQREWTYEAGLNKRLAGGGELRVGQNFGTIDNNSNFLNPPDQGSSRFVVDYRQPLLRQAGRNFNTAQILLAALNFDATTSEARENTQRFIVEVVTAYWDVYLARVQLIQNRRSVYRAQQLLDQLRNRFGIDVSNDQLLRAEAATAARKSDVIRAEYGLANAQDILNNLTMGPDASNGSQVELIPDALNLPCMIRMSHENLIEVALHNRPEIRETFARIKEAAVNQQLSTNLLLPRLDAIIQSSVQGLQGNKDFTTAFVDQFTDGNPGYSVGLSYDLPVGNRAAKARLERAELETSLIQSELRKTVGDVMVDVRIASREITRLNQEVRNNFNALIKAAQELELIRQRRDLGLDANKTGSFYIEDLLASQARLTVAEQRLTESQRAQAVAVVDVKRATGELFHVNASLEHCNRSYAVPITPYNNLPPVVHQLGDLYPENENDFAPAKPGIHFSLRGRAKSEEQLNDNETTRQPLTELPDQNQFENAVQPLGN